MITNNGIINWNQVKDRISKHKDSCLKIGQEFMDANGTTYRVVNVDTESHEVNFVRKYTCPRGYSMIFTPTNEIRRKEFRMHKYLNTNVSGYLSEVFREIIVPRTY